jgi:hypothetical protein
MAINSSCMMTSKERSHGDIPWLRENAFILDLLPIRNRAGLPDILETCKPRAGIRRDGGERQEKDSIAPGNCEFFSGPKNGLVDNK